MDLPAGNSTVVFTGLSPIWMTRACRSAPKAHSR
ncbi:MAG: hypothetical protein ACLRMJ_00665 [Alistipes finegoldii]